MDTRTQQGELSEFLTVKQAAVVLGTTAHKLRLWLRLHNVPVAKFGWQIALKRSDVAEMLIARRKAAMAAAKPTATATAEQ